MIEYAAIVYEHELLNKPIRERTEAAVRRLLRSKGIDTGRPMTVWHRVDGPDGPYILAEQGDQVNGRAASHPVWTVAQPARVDRRRWLRAGVVVDGCHAIYRLVMGEAVKLRKEAV